MTLSTPRRTLGFLLLWLAAISVQGQQATNRVFSARAAAAFDRAKREWSAHPNVAAAACALGRTSYDWAEFATNTEQRAAVAEAGMTACRQLVARDPKCALGHYYLAMDYGEWAEAEEPSMAAYRMIREIEREFKAAYDLDARLDFAGPTRCLGLLYRDAPGWPISIGNRHKAKEFLDRAAALAPDYPENQLNLVESHVRWRQAAEAEKAWQKLSAIWPGARTNLTGVVWESSWDDWITRRAAVKVDYQTAFRKNLP